MLARAASGVPVLSGCSRRGRLSLTDSESRGRLSVRRQPEVVTLRLLVLSSASLSLGEPLPGRAESQAPSPLPVSLRGSQQRLPGAFAPQTQTHAASVCVPIPPSPLSLPEFTASPSPNLIYTTLEPEPAGVTAAWSRRRSRGTAPSTSGRLPRSLSTAALSPSGLAGSRVEVRRSRGC